MSYGWEMTITHIWPVVSLTFIALIPVILLRLLSISFGRYFAVSELIKYGPDQLKMLPGEVVFQDIFSFVNPANYYFIGMYLFSVLLIYIIYILVKIGFIKIFLNISNGEKHTFKHVLRYQHIFWKFIGVTILYTTAVVLGTILLIIPGIYIAVKYIFAPILVIDKEMKPVKAMSESAKMTVGIKWKIIGFGLVLFVINFLGAALLGLGAVITTPITTFALIFVYKKFLV